MTPEQARAFIARAVWVFASSMPWAPHEYTQRWACRAQGIEAEFEAFVVWIEDPSGPGYWRPWGGHHWRSVDFGGHVFWLHHNYVASPRERTIVNRWHRDQMGSAPPQLSLEDVR
jgi:hypothetical protein